MRGGVARGGLAAIVALALLVAPADAAIPDSLKSACQRGDAADGDASNGADLPYWVCDDGVPDQGGTTPNPGAVRAVAVPQRYGGDGFTGLPPKTQADPDSGADADGDIALDVVVALPDPERFPPQRGGYPMVAMSHGCCSGSARDRLQATFEQGTSHPNAVSFAARGYIAVTYTMRGFVDGFGKGSTGVTQLDSRRYEINDLQHLLGQVADTSFTVGGRTITADPGRVVLNGGSYSGGLTWMTFTDPTWSSPGGKAMRVVAVAPRFGWTDLVYALLPNGTHDRDALPDPTVQRATTPLGLFKRSIVAGLYAAGTTGTPNPNNPGPPSHATFPPWMGNAVACAQSPLPIATNPGCTSSINEVLPELVNDRSAYYQNHFFERIRSDRSARPAIFSAAPFTDPLFTPVEHRRMVERLKSVVPDYPVKEYYGDYEHFVQNKAKEWSDLCGSDRRICVFRDYPGGDVNGVPRGLQRTGVTSRLNRFLDHYAKPPGNAREPQPAFDVTAGLQICPANAGGPFPLDEPGERFTESTFDALAPENLRLTATGTQTTANDAEPNPHAARADPVANEFGGNQKRCPVEDTPAGPGVAVYDFPALESDVVMMGRTRVTVAHSGTGSSELQLDARLYEVFPDGRQVMVDRGERALTSPDGPTTFDLHGNGWRFTAGNRLRIELTQDEEPYLRSSAVPSSLTLTSATLDIPVRRVGPDALSWAPEVATDLHRNRSFPFELSPRSGEMIGLSRGEVEVRRGRSGTARGLRVRGAALVQTGPATVAQMGTAKRSAIRGRLGRTYTVRARLFDRRDVAGDWSDPRVVVIPFDDRQRRVIQYGRGWKRVKSRNAYGRGLSRARRRGAALRFRFRGDTLYLVGRRSRRGGRALVVLNGRRRVVRFRARRTQNRRVVLKLAARRRGVNRLRLVSLGGRVEIDAIGARRL